MYSDQSARQEASGFPAWDAFARRKTSEISRRDATMMLLATFSPFLGLVLGLFHPRDSAAKNLVWVFTVFYGTVFYIASWSTADSLRYVEQLRFMHNTGFGFGDLVGSFFANRQSYQDLYQPLVTFLVSRVTDETWLLFGAFGILLGYVYSRNVWFLIEKLPRRPGLTIWVLVLAFAFVVGIGVSFNGVRMWTALHVFIFGVLYFSDTKQPKYLLIALLSPLIHFSFVIPCGLLIAFLFVKRFGLAIYVFFVVSFFIGAIDVAVIRSTAEYLPLTMGERATSGYIDRAEDYGMAGGADGQTAWFLVLNSTLVLVFVFLAATWLFYRKAHERTGPTGFLLLFGMLIYGSINLVTHIPSAGRFFSIGEMLMIAALVLFLAGQPRVKKLDFLLASAALPLLGIDIALGVRFFFEFASVWLMAGNFFIAPFVGADVGLYELIKSLR